MTIERDDLLGMSRRELLDALRSGHAIEASTLDDREYRGIALGMPEWVEKLSWKKFKKVFHRDPDTGELRGWNVRIEQSPLDDPAWEPMRDGGEPVTFGFYRVEPLSKYRVPHGISRGLMIDYGAGDNGRLDPMRRVRDPLVAVNDGSNELLLGWSYVDLGLFNLGTPSYFALERDIELSHVHQPPRRR